MYFTFSLSLSRSSKIYSNWICLGDERKISFSVEKFFRKVHSFRKTFANSISFDTIIYCWEIYLFYKMEGAKKKAKSTSHFHLFTLSSCVYLYIYFPPPFFCLFRKKLMVNRRTHTEKWFEIMWSNLQEYLIFLKCFLSHPPTQHIFPLQDLFPPRPSFGTSIGMIHEKFLLQNSTIVWQSEIRDLFIFSTFGVVGFGKRNTNAKQLSPSREFIDFYLIKWHSLGAIHQTDKQPIWTFFSIC